MTNVQDSAPDVVDALYETLALGIDRAGPQNETLFLAKLALLLGIRAADAQAFAAAIKTALQDLPGPTPTRPGD